MATIENKEVVAGYPYRNDMTDMQMGQGQMPRMTPMRNEMPPVRNEMPPMTVQGPPAATDRSYIPGYLAANIGRNVRAEFVIGNFNLDKAGTIIEVGTNYFVLRDTILGTDVMCDLYSVKFVTLV